LTVSEYPYAHLFVKAACDTFPSLSKATDGGVDPSEWLDGNATSDANGARVYQIGIPVLCPTFAKDIDAALKGLATKSNGTYEVIRGPGKIAPGKQPGPPATATGNAPARQATSSTISSRPMRPP
jgi:hypothetical protein